MAVNPAGFVPLFDTGIPKLLTGRSDAVTSGGQFVFASGAVDVVSSGANSFVAADINWVVPGSGLLFNGIAVITGSTGDYISVMTEGVAIVTAAGTVTGGQHVRALDHAVADNNFLSGGYIVGRALTSTATSGNYVAVYFRA